MSINEKFRGWNYVDNKSGNPHELKCGYCGNSVSALEVASYHDTQNKYIYWIICPLCSHGTVLDRSGRVSPATIYGEQIRGLSTEVNSAYEEARNCMSVSAFTACQLLCRKILMHVAIEKCGSSEGDTFENYIKAIETAGYITTPMKSWVEKIRKEGNDATHKLQPPLQKDAENIINFTAQLLKLVYEMDHIYSQFSS